MKILTPQDKLDKPYSIFLAGPSPRGPAVASWRPEAIEFLKKYDYDGTVYSPEPIAIGDDYYKHQVEWENDCLEKATCVLFWIPRDLDTLPGFTTNIEFGEYMRSGKAVVGIPKEAERVTYIKSKCYKHGIPLRFDLEETVTQSIVMSKWIR